MIYPIEGNIYDAWHRLYYEIDNYTLDNAIFLLKELNINLVINSKNNTYEFECEEPDLIKFLMIYG